MMSKYPECTQRASNPSSCTPRGSAGGPCQWRRQRRRVVKGGGALGGEEVVGAASGKAGRAGTRNPAGATRQAVRPHTANIMLLTRHSLSEPRPCAAGAQQHCPCVLHRRLTFRRDLRCQEAARELGVERPRQRLRAARAHGGGGGTAAWHGQGTCGKGGHSCLARPGHRWRAGAATRSCWACRQPRMLAASAPAQRRLAGHWRCRSAAHPHGTH